MSDSFESKDTLTVSGREYEIFRLDSLQEKFDTARLPLLLRELRLPTIAAMWQTFTERADREAQRELPLNFRIFSIQSPHH